MNAARRLLSAAIRVYQLTLSPLLGDCCRFEPSCSRYCQACITHHGLLRGGMMSAWRLLRCNPLFAGGFDPPRLPAHVDPSEYEPNWQRVTAWTLRSVAAHSPPGTAPLAERRQGVGQESTLGSGNQLAPSTGAREPHAHHT